MAQADSEHLYLIADADATGIGDIVFKTGNSERARIKVDGSGSGLLKEFTIPGSTVFAIGDSITANGNSSGIAGTSLTLSTRIGPLSYLGWASMLSSGKILFAGASGTGGFTIAQVRATHVPVAIAANPGMCVVLAGTNDVGNIALGTETIQTAVSGT
jgi:lysophospholipase L1-like esterase